MSFFKAIAIYVLVGPAIGFAALFLSMQLQASSFFGLSANDKYLIPLIYVFGFLPALGTGLVTYAVRKHFSFALLVVASGIVGALLSSAIWLVQPDSITTALQLGVLPGFFGAVGAAVLAKNSLRIAI